MKSKLLIALIILGSCIIISGCNKDRLFLKNDSGSFTDERDDKTYSWVKMSEQIWMAENLAYLPEVTPNSADITSQACYFVYGYIGTDITTAKSSYNYKTYGVLYNWLAASTACPEGWHLPTDDEWEQMANYVNLHKGPYIGSGGSWNELGKHLKATEGWYDNGYGTDDFGFSALPAGYLGYPNSFYDLGNFCFWWTATKYQNDRYWDRYLSYDKNDFTRSHHKESAFSVRCVRN